MLESAAPDAEEAVSQPTAEVTTESEKQSNRPWLPPGKSSVVGTAILPVLPVLVLTTPFFPLLFGPLGVVVVPFLLGPSSPGSLMLPPVSRSRCAAELRIGLLGSRNGSASALQGSQRVDRDHVVVNVLHNVRVDFLLGLGHRDERRVELREDLKAVLRLDDGVRRGKLVRAIKSVPEPEQNIVVHNQC